MAKSTRIKAKNRMAKRIVKKAKKPASSTSKQVLKAKQALKPTGKYAKSFTVPLLVRVDFLDEKLLNLAKQPYSRIRKKIEAGKKRLDAEKRVALELGERILDRAEKVRAQMAKAAKSRV